MKSKGLAIGKALLWCLVMLLFPTLSGTLSVVLSLTAVETLFLQGAFMLFALIPPAAFVLRGRWRWEDIGFAPFNFEGCKQALYFLPILVIFVPVALKGFHAGPLGYVLGNLFLYLWVGVSEELYFRGVIPQYLKKEFIVAMGGESLLAAEGFRGMLMFAAAGWLTMIRYRQAQTAGHRQGG